MTNVKTVITHRQYAARPELDLVWAIAEGRSCAAGVDDFLMKYTDLPSLL